MHKVWKRTRPKRFIDFKLLVCKIMNRRLKFFYTNVYEQLRACFICILFEVTRRKKPKDCEFFFFFWSNLRMKFYKEREFQQVINFIEGQPIYLC